MSQPVLYQGALFEGARPAHALSELLHGRDLILELGDARHTASCVLGVPHHAGPGVDKIAEQHEDGGRVADENAVLYALAAHEALRRRGVSSCVVVAVHATDHDPNKHAESPYCRALLEGAPRLLIECHGSGWATPHPVEISAGVNHASEPLAFGRRVAAELGESGWVAAQCRPGEREGHVLAADGGLVRESALKFPALRTTSLQCAAERGIPSIHVEAMPRFRTFGVTGLSLPDDGAALGLALAGAVVETLSQKTTRGPNGLA